jgi:hypothetical protein
VADDSDESELIAAVPEDGSNIGNGRLMSNLDWDEKKYWQVRNRLVDRGVLEVGRGRGGSVRRVTDEVLAAPVVAPPPTEQSPSPQTEAELYAPMAGVLGDRWMKDKRFDSSIVQITAHQGRRATGGTWSRPDIAAATLATYPYIPGRHFDVVTFEVKPRWNLDVTAVYEALGHLRSATLSYVLAHVETVDDTLEESLIEVCAEARRYGIGVIIAEKANDYDTWEERVEPVRGKPEPRRLNDFLAKQFTADQLEQIVKWFR